MIDIAEPLDFVQALRASVVGVSPLRDVLVDRRDADDLHGKVYFIFIA
jgi:hypothetical protein